MSNRKAYRKTAKKYGVSLSELKRDMQAAIDYGYQNTPNNGITGAYQNRVPRKGEIPTFDEVVNYAKGEVKKRK